MSLFFGNIAIAQVILHFRL